MTLKHVVGGTAGFAAAAVIGLVFLGLLSVDNANPGARSFAATDPVRPDAVAASGGFIIPTMSFDARVDAYAKLATIEPGLPIKDYFDDFFPARCDYRGDENDSAFRKTHKSSGERSACRLQSAVICDATLPDLSTGDAKGQNQGFFLDLLGSNDERRCGLVTTAHGWASFTPPKDRTGASCWASDVPTAELLERVRAHPPFLTRQKRKNVSNYSQWHQFAQLGPNDRTVADFTGESTTWFDGFLPEIDATRIQAADEAMRLGLFGTVGSLTTDLHYQRMERSQCSRRTDTLSGSMVTFQQVRSLTSVDALRKTCDEGVAICASPSTGQVTDQKRCSFYPPSELGKEGDVYDFRQLKNGKGVVRHYGTSFKGLSGAGHYCLKKGSQPIPFGMSVAVFSNPANTDRETYNKWLGLYIMQGLRERGDYVVVQHLANLADFEEFRKHQKMD